MKWILLFLINLPVFANAQDLTGTWVGNSGMAYVKLVIIHKGDSVFGYTYDEGPGFCKATFFGKYTRYDARLVGRGQEMIKNSGSHGLAKYDLEYSKYDTVEYLRGFVNSRSLLVNILSGGETDAISLKKFRQKVDTIDYMRKLLSPPPPEGKINDIAVTDTVSIRQPAIVPQVTPMAKTEPPVIERKNMRISRLVESIKTSADTIRMMVYDNGEIDGDSVTIFFDNKVILDRYRITAEGKEVMIPVPKDTKAHNIELFANNLGSIPPNTALVIITAGSKRYELRTSYDLQTNALISIEYVPD